MIEGQRDAAPGWFRLREEGGIDIVGNQARRHIVRGFGETIEAIDWTRMTAMDIRDNRQDIPMRTVAATPSPTPIAD